MATIERKIISTTLAAKPVAPYNQAVVADRTVYVSGCLGMTKDLKIVSGGASAEAKLALENMGHILTAAGSSFDKVVKTTIFLQDINDLGAVTEEYKKVFTHDFPARSCVEVGKLPMGSTVQIECIALTNNVITVSA